MVTARRTRSVGQPQNGGTPSPTAVVRAPLKRATPHLKHKRRYCRMEGCNRIVKSQGLCQRHGAKPKTCSVEGCTKQAQGNFDKMCKAHFKAMKRETTPIPKVVIHDAPPKPEGETVYANIIPRAIAFDAAAAAAMAEGGRQGGRHGINPLVAHLKHGFDSLKPPAWHRNEERKARGVVQVENPATQLTGWERELVWMEILILTGIPGASFRHLARAWGRDKGFHMVLAQFICERHGNVQRKKRLGEDADCEGPVDPGVVARRPPKKRKPRRRSARRATSGGSGKGGNDGTPEDDTDADEWDPSMYDDVDMLEAIFDFNEDDMPKQNKAEDGSVSPSSSNADLERKAAMKCLLGDGDMNLVVVNDIKSETQSFTEASQDANRGTPKVSPMQEPNNQMTYAPVAAPSPAPQQQMHQGQSDQQAYNLASAQASASQQQQTHQPYQEIANHGLYELAAPPATFHHPLKQEPVDQMAFASAPAPREQSQQFDPSSEVVYANAEAQSVYANAQAAHIHHQQQQQDHTDQVVYINAPHHQMPQQPHVTHNIHHQHRHQAPPASQEKKDDCGQVVYAGVQSPHQLPEAPTAKFHQHPPQLQQRISFNAQLQSQLQQLPPTDDGLAQRQQRFLQEHPGEPVPSDAILRRLFNVGPSVAPSVLPPAPPPVAPPVLAQEYQQYQYQRSVYPDPPANLQMAQQPEYNQKQAHKKQQHQQQPQETTEYHQHTSVQVNPLAEQQEQDTMQLQHQSPTVQIEHEQEQHTMNESAMMEAPDALEVHHAMHIEESNLENNSASRWS